MRKVWWMLAVPYFVQVTTQNNHKISRRVCDSYWCLGECPSQSICEDQAAALNEAHERRTKEPILSDRSGNSITAEELQKQLHWKDSKKADWQDLEANPEKKIKRPEPFDYKAACGQDDCGAEPNGR